MPFTVSPTHHWHEYPTKRDGLTVGLLTPYLLTDGSVEFLTSGDTIPGGAVIASVVDSGDGTDEIVSPAVPAGRRVVESDSLFFL